LLAADATAQEAHDIEYFADTLSQLAIGERESSNLAKPRRATGLPVCQYWQPILEAAEDGPTAELAGTLGELGPALTWVQSPDYVRYPPSANFVENYGYAVIVGPQTGPPALVTHDRLAAGLLMFGPQTCYPLHHHPAVEIYFIVSGQAKWWRGTGPWEFKLPGALIHHSSELPHGTWTTDEPLLAVYLWRGDLETDARFIK
jgi:quercetin dioxygenase-like cupin family protein